MEDIVVECGDDFLFDLFYPLHFIDFRDSRGLSVGTGKRNFPAGRMHV